MFYVLFLICILGGLCLGVRMAMRHAEIYFRFLKSTDNSTIAAVGEVSDTFYDTEHVNEVEANSEENPEENLAFQHSLVTEDTNGSSPDRQESYTEMETDAEPVPENVTDPIVEELALNTQSRDEPEESANQRTNRTNEIDLTVPIFESRSKTSVEDREIAVPNPEEINLTPEKPKVSPKVTESAPTVEMISEMIELPKDWPTSEAAQQIIQMIPRESGEMETLAAIYNEAQDMLIEFENVAPESMETWWISNAGDAKYVNRVICRPRIGT